MSTNPLAPGFLVLPPSEPASERLAALAEAIDAALPQTQCTRCGYPDCRAYARAIASGEAGIDRCPPGGAEGIARLARLTGRAAGPLDPAHGTEGPLRLAVIDDAACIGCTLCIKACPVDCIVGAAKRMHTVIASQCTGCELCLPACPVDCIALVPAAPGPGGPTGWAAWSAAQAEAARGRYLARAERLQRRRHQREERLAARGRALTVQPPEQRPAAPGPCSAAPTDCAAAAGAGTPAAASSPPVSRSAVIEAAIARARARRSPGA